MQFGFLAFPGLEELDLVGPWEMIAVWSEFFHGPERCMVIAQSATPVQCAKGLSINPHATFAECPALDVLLIPGGKGTRTEVDNPVLVEFIRRQAATCKAVLSVCTGSFLLHRAGVLSGRKATTHWGSLDRLRELGDVRVVEERIVRSGNIWTAAGVSSGIDLALAFIADSAGEQIAGKVQFYAEYYPTTRYYGDAHRDGAAPGYLKNLT